MNPDTLFVIEFADGTKREWLTAPTSVKYKGGFLVVTRGNVRYAYPAHVIKKVTEYAR